MAEQKRTTLRRFAETLQRCVPEFEKTPPRSGYLTKRWDPNFYHCGANVRRFKYGGFYWLMNPPAIYSLSPLPLFPFSLFLPILFSFSSAFIW